MASDGVLMLTVFPCTAISPERLGAVINYIPYVGGIVGTILSIFLFVRWIMRLIYACQEQEKELPLIGQINILK